MHARKRFRTLPDAITPASRSFHHLPACMHARRQACRSALRQGEGGGQGEAPAAVAPPQLLFRDSDRHGTFAYGGRQYPVTVLNLPSVVESYKTLDDVNLVKTTDIGQVWRSWGGGRGLGCGFRPTLPRHHLVSTDPPLAGLPAADAAAGAGGGRGGAGGPVSRNERRGGSRRRDAAHAQRPRAHLSQAHRRTAARCAEGGTRPADRAGGEYDWEGRGRVGQRMSRSCLSSCRPRPSGCASMGARYK